jgi:transcriptional regulator with XRE-family HTH domain
LTREDLSDLCGKRGLPLSPATIANIETGRRDASGKRRREVTVDELVILAEALNIAPVLLVFPVGQESTVLSVGDAAVGTWEAAKWFGGHGEHPVGSVGSDVRRVYREPIRLFSDYEQANRRLWHARAKLGVLRRRAQTENGDTANLVAWTEETVAEAEESLRDITRRMIDRGMQPPGSREPSHWESPDVGSS